MPNLKTRFDEFMDDIARRRVYTQESLAFEATELISELMEDQNVTKAELAKRIGKSKAYVTQLLSGSRNMTLHTFADLAFAMGQRIELKAASLGEKPALVRNDEKVAPKHQHSYPVRWSNVVFTCSSHTQVIGQFGRLDIDHERMSFAAPLQYDQTTAHAA